MNLVNGLFQRSPTWHYSRSMRTIRDTLESSLVPYLGEIYQADFDRLSIRNYGFQPPGLLDPNRSRQGYNLNGIIDVSPADAPGLHSGGDSMESVSVLMGKIVPFYEPVSDSYWEAFDLGHKIKRSVVDWGRCGEGVQTSSVRFAITEDQDRNTTISLKSKWWVLRWQFDMIGYFSVI